MAKFFLPKGSRVAKGKRYGNPDNAFPVSVYRYTGKEGDQPRIDVFFIPHSEPVHMVLDALIYIKDHMDSSLSFRRSCREGVCGSCSMNVNGENTLACTKSMKEVAGSLVIYPLPHMPVIKDLVPDLTHAYEQYKQVKPWLETNHKAEGEHIQTPEERKKLDGHWECVLCFSCSTGCPSYWWNQKDYLGPAVLLQAARFIEDSRDNKRHERLQQLNDEMKLYRCHTILNCTKTCPKGLNPGKAIGRIKKHIAADSSI